MRDVELSVAKSDLDDLVARAVAGECVRILHHGEPLVELVPARRPRKPIDVDALRALTATMKPQAESAGDFVRRMRDENRY